MKFARYLQETQTPEWKRAYIDYRGLKKKITAVRRAQDGPLPGDERSASSSPDITAAESIFPNLHSTSNASIDAPNSVHSDTAVEAPGAASGIPEASRVVAQAPEDSTIIPYNTDEAKAHGSRRRPRQIRRATTFSRVLSNVGRARAKMTNNFNAEFKDVPLHALLSLLSPVERSFFAKLDSELEKIESFYLDREKEMRARTKVLKDQLAELADHRKRYHAANAVQHQPKASIRGTTHGFDFFSKLRQVTKCNSPPNASDPKAKSSQPTIEPLGENKRDYENEEYGKTSPLPKSDVRLATEAAAPKPASKPQVQTDRPRPNSADRRSLDPDEYLHAKKKLKRAVLEHHRALETLKNYRILNLTGFRKALKKFEKVTKNQIPVQQAYMSEKVERSAISTDTLVNAMVNEMEDLYALRFERGDKKKAMNRLRAGKHVKSHHFSTFRSGMLLGLALPPLVSGLVKCFQQDTRASIPGWDGLLYIYGLFLLPVVFSLLVGLNLLAWSRSRINYVFIFELDVRTVLDHREFFEIPSLLLSTLCYAFWLSFSRIGSPTRWPLIWLAVMAIIVFEPLSLLYKPSRYWLLRSLGKLLVPGTRRVEFTDFWMGDQICSLVWTLSNLYTFVCIYVQGFDRPWRTSCTTSSARWPIAFVLASLPFIIRLLQSIRRYADSGLVTHLINAGKYASGIISYLFFTLWRHNGDRGMHMALWCVFNAIYSTYALAWDLLMDWSFLRISPEVKFPLLRPELVYSNYVPLYYFAIASNVLIRFIWVIYIPVRGPNILIRTFIGGALEMLRRWQWNFFRLENEHLGNVDQYRVSREVPLPYSFDDASQDDDEDEKIAASQAVK